ncbi:MAG: tetratricopeptide repeat protein [Planctomycetota bacterium]|nr:tetratricopeptide repeat protein [Planctomycetota bacterium]
MKSHSITSILLGIVLLGITGCAPHPTTATVREQASDALWAERYGEAETLYGELAERFPQDWRVQYGFGVSAMHTGNLSEARQALEIAHTLRPANRDIAVDLAEVMFLQDDRNGLFLFLHDRAQSRSDSRDWLLLAEYSLMTEDPDSARECIEKAMVVDDASSAGTWLEAATLSERMGDLDSAMMYLRTAYTIEPDNTVVQDRLRAHGLVPGPTLAMPNDPA